MPKFGHVLETRPPRVKLRVLRGEIPNVLAGLLSRYSIEDVSVSDRPLEEVFAEMFESHRIADRAAADAAGEQTDEQVDNVSAASSTK